MPTALCSRNQEVVGLLYRSAGSFRLISTGIRFPTEIPAFKSESNLRLGQVPISSTFAPAWSCSIMIPAGLSFSSRLILVHFINAGQLMGSHLNSHQEALILAGKSPPPSARDQLNIYARPTRVSTPNPVICVTSAIQRFNDFQTFRVTSGRILRTNSVNGQKCVLKDEK